MKRTFLLLIFVMLSKAVVAQFNDSTHYYIRYLSTGSINSTDEGHSYLLNNALKLGVSKAKFTMNGNASYVYGEANDVISNNDFSSSVDFNYKSTLPHLYYWGLANYDKSISLKINDRLQSGVGLGYSLLETKTSFLNISDGILYEKSDLFLKDTIHDVYHTFRNSFRVSYRFVIKDIIIIDGVNYYQNSLSHGEDYIIKSTTNLSIKLRKWLLLTSSLQYNRLNRTGKENFLLNYGITVEKYF